MTTLDEIARTAPRPGTAGTRERQSSPTTIIAAGKTSFLVAPFAFGPIAPSLIGSPDDLDARYAPAAEGKTGVYSPGYADAQVILSRGRGPLVLSRVISPGAVASTAPFLGATAAASLVITATNPGVAGDLTGIDIVTSGATFDITVTYDGVFRRKVSGLASTAEAALVFSADPDVRVSAAGPALPVATVATVNLAGGDDDTAGINAAAWTAALERLTPTMLLDYDSGVVLVGAGQIGMPGRTETAAWTELLAHGQANNRTAFCDSTDQTLDAAGMTALLAEGDTFAELTSDDRGGLFGCWTDYADPGVVGGRRIVPASGLAMAATANADPGYGTRSWPIGSDGAGHPNGLALRLRAEPTDDQRRQLTERGVNHGKRFLTGPALYGFRSGAREEHLVDLGVQRLGMGIDHDITLGKEQAVGKSISVALQILATVAEDVLGARYATTTELDGSDPAGVAKPSPRRAYGVDTVAVNSATTARDRQVRIEYWFRPQGVAELVISRTVIVPIGS